MNPLYEKQTREINLLKGETNRKQDLLLREIVERDVTRESNRKLPYRDESVRKDVEHTLKRYNSKICEDNLRVCEESFGQKLGEIKSGSNREEKLRQLLWDTSPELRELRKQMLVADVARDQAMQLAQKAATAELRKEEEDSLVADLEEDKRKYDEELRMLEQRDFEAKKKYHKDLDDLNRYKSEREDRRVELLQREKEAIDEMKRKIHEEDLAVVRRKLESQKEYHRQAVELQKVRDGMRELERQKQATLEVRADEYRKAQELRAKHEEEKKELSAWRRLQLQEELLSYLERMIEERESHELLRTELDIAEKDARDRRKEEGTERKQRALREELQQVYDLQLYVKKQKEELQKKEDALFRESFMAQLYEDEKLEHMSQHKRRLKQIEHRRIIQALLEQSRQKKEEEVARDAADNQLLRDMESERQRLVDEERKRFLGEHAKELLGYLPKGVFRNKGEVERLGEEFKNFYSRKKCSTLYQD